MSSNVRDRLVKSFAAQGFAQVVNLLIQIGTVPLFLHFWGKVLYGEWILLSTVPSYFSMSDLGFANAAGTEMTLRVARGDRAGALKVFQSAWVLITALTLLITVVMLGLVAFLPLAKWLHVTTLTHQEIVAVVSILIFQLFFDMQTGLISNGYRCDGHFAAGTMVRNIQRLAEFGAAALVLCLGGHLAALALAVMLTRLLGNLLSALDVKRRSPWLALGWGQADWATIRSIASPAVTSIGFPIGHSLSLQGMVTVVGATLGPVAVVQFSTSRTLTRFVWQLMNAITNTIWVELSTAFGANDVPLARRLHRRACQAAVWLAFVCSAALYVAGPWIFRLWTHGKIVFDPVLFGILLVVVICNSFWSVSYIVLVSVNRHQRLAAVYVLATGLSLAVGYVLIRLIGIHGAALALLVIDIFMTLYVLSRSLELVQDPLPDFLRAIAKPPVFNSLRGHTQGENVMAENAVAEMVEPI